MILKNGQHSQFERDVLPEFIRQLPLVWRQGSERFVPCASWRRCRFQGRGAPQFWFVEVSLNDGAPETYALPVQISSGETARAIAQATPEAVIARFVGAEETILHDAIYDAAFRDQLFPIIGERQALKGKSGELLGAPGKTLQADGNVPRPISLPPNRAIRRCCSKTNTS